MGPDHDDWTYEDRERHMRVVCEYHVGEQNSVPSRSGRGFLQTQGPANHATADSWCTRSIKPMTIGGASQRRTRASSSGHLESCTSDGS